jgi:Holliday junction resolvase RusA-like endonuclease
MSDQPAVVINFPRPPSANRMFLRQMTRRGHRDLTPEYKAWRDTAGWAVKMQIVGLETITSKFNIVVEVPLSSRVDLDNNLKPILDLAQNMGIISNDRNCVGISITPTAREDVMVAIWCLPEMGAVRKAATPRGAKGADGRRDISRRAVKMRPGLTWKMPA